MRRLGWVLAVLLGFSTAGNAQLPDSVTAEVAAVAHFRAHFLGTKRVAFLPDYERGFRERPGLRSDSAVAAIVDALGGPELAIVCRPPSKPCKKGDAKVALFIFSGPIVGDSVVIRLHIGEDGESAGYTYVLRRVASGWAVVRAALAWVS